MLLGIMLVTCGEIRWSRKGNVAIKWVSDYECFCRLMYAM